MGHLEYWRLYQSGQFVHLFSVREFTEEGWREKLQSAMESHTRGENLEIVPGFISIVNFTYSVTEIFEFAARLCGIQLYQGAVEIKIEIKKIKGFVLAAPWDRVWNECYAASEENLGNSWTLNTELLFGKTTENALSAITWFFERFGWMEPNEAVIRSDINKLLHGRANGVVILPKAGG